MQSREVNLFDFNIKIMHSKYNYFIIPCYKNKSFIFEQCWSSFCFQNISNRQVQLFVGFSFKKI